MDGCPRSSCVGGRAMADAHASRLTAWAPGRHPLSSDGGSRRPFRYIARPMDGYRRSNVLIPIHPSRLSNGFRARDVSHESSRFALAEWLREHGACGYALHSFVADSFARTHRPHFAATMFGFACFVSFLRHHPKRCVARASRRAGRPRRQTARQERRSLRLRCSCLRVWAFATPSFVSRRLSAGRDA